ncbi:MAG: hypothetical protein U0T84_13685 [Chitinophagales bacterium]
MQLPVIKDLVEKYDLGALRAAEDALLNEQEPAISIIGKDEGERLTHILAAMEILHDMEKNQLDYRTALRNYTQRVRNSIN